MTKEKYFVAIDGDEAERIFFDKELAFENESDYIDSFDDKGMPINSYKIVENKDGVFEYTEDF